MTISGELQKIHSARHVTNEGQSVSVASASDDGRRPETGPDFDRREDPSGAALAADERVELIRLKLFDSDSRDRLAVETTAHLGCPLEPARDGVPGNPLDPSNRGNADTLDSESDDRIKGSSSMLETVVGRAFRRRERLSALDAPVSTAFPRPRSVETVADDASGTDFSVQRTLGVETAELLHFAGPCRRKNCVFRNRAQTLPRTWVRRRPPTLDCGSTGTVERWRPRFLHFGLEGLQDRPRPGHKPKFDSVTRLQLIALACEPMESENGVSRRTIEQLRQASISQCVVEDISWSSVQRILAQAEIRPHLVRSWMHSPDPMFREKVTDITELYLNPPPGEVVLCVDEKTGMQALQRRLADQPPAPSRARRREFEYKRHGT